MALASGAHSGRRAGLVCHIRTAGLGQAAKTELADRIRWDEGVTHLAQHRPDVDEHAMAMPAKHRNHEPRGIHGPEEIRLEHLPVGLEVALIQTSEDRRPRVGDPGVNPPSAFQRVRNQMVQVGPPAQCRCWPR